MQDKSLVNFAGHGSDEVWAGGLLSSSDVAALTNGSQTPFVISMTCLNGYFRRLYGQPGESDHARAVGHGGRMGIVWVDRLTGAVDSKSGDGVQGLRRPVVDHRRGGGQEGGSQPGHPAYVDPSGGPGNQATVEIVEVAKSRWLRNQPVNRVVALTLTFKTGQLGSNRCSQSVCVSLSSAPQASLCVWSSTSVISCWF